MVLQQEDVFAGGRKIQVLKIIMNLLQFASKGNGIEFGDLTQNDDVIQNGCSNK